MDEKYNVRILLIEDNTSFANLIHFLVEEEEDCPWFVQHVSSLASGIECLKKQEFDVVVLDFYLPDSEGMESIAQIRLINQKIPIIFLTALDDPQTEAKALANGAAGYLQKDVVIKVFTKTIRENLPKR